MQKRLIGLILIISVLFLSGCSKKDYKSGEIEGYKYEEVSEETNYVKLLTDKNKVILIELYPDIAPITVENFKKLVNEKFYDGTTFHRVIEDFMIQGGISADNKSADNIKGEFANNGVENNLKHEEGIVSMARAEDMDSASSQFFICVNDNTALGYLDGNYAAFGKVIAGYKNVVNISEVEADIYDAPTVKQGIKTIRFVKVEES